MSVFLRVACFILWLLPVAGSAAQDNIDHLVVFGDSFSDMGRIHAMTDGHHPVSPPHYQGRFSDGPVWVEYLAEELGATIGAGDNFAVGGARTGVGNASEDFAGTGVLNQVSDWRVGSGDVASSSTLFVLMAGANDFLFSLETAPENAASNMREAMNQLHQMGARQFLIGNLPDLSMSPFGEFLSEREKERLRTQTAGFNAALASEIESMKSASSGEYVLFDAAELFRKVLSSPQAFEIDEAEKPRYDGKIVDPGNAVYFWWDAVHPSTRAMALMGKEAAETWRNRGNSVASGTE